MTTPSPFDATLGEIAKVTAVGATAAINISQAVAAIENPQSTIPRQTPVPQTLAVVFGGAALLLLVWLLLAGRS